MPSEFITTTHRRPVFRKINLTNQFPQPAIAREPIWKQCSYCFTFFKAFYAESQHCYQCCCCKHQVSRQKLAGKARYIGYVCKHCYTTVVYTRGYEYTILYDMDTMYSVSPSLPR